MENSRIVANDLSCYKGVSEMSRYSGSHPQTLPLPPELVVRTLSYLNKARDKKNARLVCKGFAAAGLYSLTSMAYFSTSLIEICHSSTVPYFPSPTREIAMHPVVSKYISKMVCDGTQLPNSYLPLQAFQKWWATLGKNQSPWPVQKIHSSYVFRYRQENWIIGKDEDRKIFRTALERFVKLKCVVFTDVAADENRRDLPRPSWPLDLPEGDLWGTTSPYHTFAMCIRSLSEMAIKLDDLSIEGRQDGMSHGMFSLASPKDYSHLLNVFANLRRISVHVSTHRDTYPVNFVGLGQLLIHATLAQSLDLKGTGGRRKSRLVLSRLFQDFTWPHLKRIGLHGFVMHTDAELIAFFDRHRATVDSVALRSMFLHEKAFDDLDDSPCEAWKHFFSELRRRSIKFQSLELFKIHDCCNSEGEHPDLAIRGNRGKKVLEYLRNGGPNPLTVDTVSEASISGEERED